MVTLSNNLQGFNKENFYILIIQNNTCYMLFDCTIAIKVRIIFINSFLRERWSQNNEAYFFFVTDFIILLFCDV